MRTLDGGGGGWLRGRAVRLVLFALLASAAFLISTQRLVLAPGVEMFAGPIFYLLAYRMFGLRAGVIAAVVFVLPSYFWWGHVFSIAMAITHVLIVDRMSRRGWSLSAATVLFHATIGVVANPLFMATHYGAPPTIMGLTVIRKLLIDLTGAVLVDVLLLRLHFSMRAFAFRRRPGLSLARAIECATLVLLLPAIILVYCSNANDFSRRFDGYRKFIVQEAARAAEQRPVAGRTLGSINPEGLEIEQILLAPPALMNKASIQRLLGCDRIDGGQGQRGANDRNTFAYWLRACEVGVVPHGKQSVAYAVPTRAIALRAYDELFEAMLPLMALLGLSLLLHAWINRNVQTSLTRWRDTVRAFGTPDLPLPALPLFSELQRPIIQFVRENNRFAETSAERERLALAFAELKETVDLSLLSDVTWDPDKRQLGYYAVDLWNEPRWQVLDVHPNDALSMSPGEDAGDLVAEFRRAGADDWHLLIARDRLAPNRWRWGARLRLKQPKLLAAGLAHQARLMELGGMASAISHELRQPLFTISLAAENAEILLENGKPEAVRGKIERITSQVARASAIIARITNYARVEHDAPEWLDLVELVRTAASFLRSLLIQHNVELRLEADPDLRTVRLPKVGVEQIIVNAIQNAVDSIASRPDQRTSGAVTIRITDVGSAVQLSISDNGAGIAAEIAADAFEPFRTTKGVGSGTGLGLYVSRQIMREIGGDITLAPGACSGAVLTLTLPYDAAADARLVA
jgi:two-component system C4-dicarboxylate transport sensor histidine kinase DctB